ncbi:MAG: radical SAM protein [Candidatus Omnitrophota bacterium]
MKKSWSCSGLHYSIFAAPDVLRHCCKRFFVNGQMRGDVEIFKVFSNSDISTKKILEHKQKLYEDINSGKETPCSSCPWIKYDDWEPFNKLKIKHLSIENHTVCNLRCTYCNETYYGGKKSNYDIMHLYKELKLKDAFDENISLVWGGGEPLLLNSFYEIFSTLTQELAPSRNNIFTNAIIYSDSVAKYLKEGKVTITTSIDAGFRSTYNKIRGSDKLITVLQNLKKYYQCDKDGITVKYLLLQENSNEDEVLAFVDKIKEYGLSGCTFQISTNYKTERIDEKIARTSIFLFNELKKCGTKLINFDDHLRPRLNSMRDSLNIKSSYSDKDVIIWGAGDYAEMMLKESSFFNNRNIRCFVDSSRQKHGKKFGPYEIKPPKAVLENEDTYIFIASTSYYRQIYSQILDMGVSPKRIIDDVVI